MCVGGEKEEGRRRRGKVGLWRRRRGRYVDGECVERGGVRVDGRMRN